MRNRIVTSASSRFLLVMTAGLALLACGLIAFLSWSMFAHTSYRFVFLFLLCIVLSNLLARLFRMHLSTAARHFHEHP